MAEGEGEGVPGASDLDIDPDFEPQKRPRSCTWPLPRPESSAGKAEPSEADIIPEEEDDEDAPDRHVVSSSTHAADVHSCPQGEQKTSSPAAPTTLAPAASASAPRDKGTHDPPVSGQTLPPAGSDSSLGSLGPQQPRKSSARRNAWGNYSYADLITQAIESSPEKRLTLAQIYDWMVRSVPYFKDKGDSNSSAGWKVGPAASRALHLEIRCICNDTTITTTVTN